MEVYSVLSVGVPLILPASISVKKNACTEGNYVINKLTWLFKEGYAFIPERSQTAELSIIYMPSLSSVSTNT